MRITERRMSATSLDLLAQQLAGLVHGKPVIFIGSPYASFLEDVSGVQALGGDVRGVIAYDGEFDATKQLNFLPRGTRVLRLAPNQDPVDWRPMANDPAVAAFLRKVDRRKQAVLICSPAAQLPFDSDGRARVNGRLVLNARPPQQARLEDKTIGLPARLGLPVPRNVVVGSDPQSLLRAFRGIDSGAGTVWSLDNKLGIPAACQGNCFVNNGTAKAWAEVIGSAANQVTVSSFVKGIPFGIELFIDASGEVAVAGVAEMLTGRRSLGNFESLGCSNSWQPPERVLRHMINQARSAGHKLYEDFGVVGWVSIDGILGRKGPVYTEVNTRVPDGAYLSTTGQAALVLPLIESLALQGIPLVVPMNTLEAEVRRLRREAPDALIGSPGALQFRKQASEVTRVPFWWNSRTLVNTPLRDEADGVITMVPSPGKDGYVFAEVGLNPAFLRKGVSLATLAADIERYYAQTFQELFPNNTVEPSETLVMQTNVFDARNFTPDGR